MNFIHCYFTVSAAVQVKIVTSKRFWVDMTVYVLYIIKCFSSHLYCYRSPGYVIAPFQNRNSATLYYNDIKSFFLVNLSVKVNLNIKIYISTFNFIYIYRKQKTDVVLAYILKKALL